MAGPWDIFGAVGSTIGAFAGADAEQQAAEQAQAKEQGALTNLENTNPTATSSVSQDPALREAALRSLASTQAAGEQGGMDIQSREAEQEALARAGQQEGARRQAVLADQARRGVVGGGSTVAGELTGGSGAANTAALSSAAAASDARGRALQDLAQSGQMASEQQGQDLATQQAKDAIARFNATGRMQQAGDVANQTNNLANMGFKQGQIQQATDINLGGAVGNTAGAIGRTVMSAVTGAPSMIGAGASPSVSPSASPGALSTSNPDILSGYAGGGEVDIMASPKEIVVPPGVAHGSPSILREFVRKNKKGAVHA
jgi:hypothetical protein